MEGGPLVIHTHMKRGDAMGRGIRRVVMGKTPYKGSFFISRMEMERGNLLRGVGGNSVWEMGFDFSVLCAMCGRPAAV